MLTTALLTFKAKFFLKIYIFRKSTKMYSSGVLLLQTLPVLQGLKTSSFDINFLV